MLTNSKFCYNNLILDKNCLILGIGGVSMSSIALLLIDMGYKVTGYDERPGQYTKMVEEHGIPVVYGEEIPSLEGVGLIVYTAAIKEDHPILALAKEKNVPFVVRAPFLGELMKCYGKRIGVSGTHGKSTTSGMISEIFMRADTDPTVVIGADLPSIGSGLKIGSKDSFIFEACEYKDSFLSFAPTLSVVLNVELDHTDYFLSLDQMKDSYSKFMEISGLAVVCGDNENAVSSAKSYGGRAFYYSVKNTNADFYADNVKVIRGFAEFDAYADGKLITSVRLRVPGAFQVSNAMAAISAAYLSGISAEDIKKGLESFRGVGRRFQYRGELNGAEIYDDYAHHPDEIRATLATAKAMERGRVLVVYQPHTYSRTHDLFDSFATSFKDCDEVIFADIYAAREKNEYGISSKDLADAVENGVYVGDFEAIADYVRNKLREDDLLIIMGAGDIINIKL